MGQGISRPRVAAAVVVAGAAGLVATACLLSRFYQSEEGSSTSKVERPTQDTKKADKDANDELMRAAEVNAASAPCPPDYDTLEVKGLLGCGGFGAVELVVDKANAKSFALKSISKGYTVKTGMQASVRAERVVLLLLNSHFIVKCYGTYNRPEYICFLLEACLGGELYATYKTKKFYGSELHARYYVASVVLALAHMHSKSVIHRNVKPEDCVLDSTGRLKLCDMGLAKLISGKTYTTCGTPDYFAPELIASTGHAFPVDWWSTGVLLFELLAGATPFAAANPMQTYSNVVKGVDRVDFPAATKEAEPLIKALLKQKPEERLPVLPGGIMNVKLHKWYFGFGWYGLEGETLAPPYEPQVESDTDLANFSASEADRPKHIPYVDDGSGWADVF